MPIQIEHGNSAHTTTAPIVGIDLGTTNSLVALVVNGTPQVISSPEGSALIPSVISFAEGKPIIGQEAKKKKVRDARHCFFSEASSWAKF